MNILTVILEALWGSITSVLQIAAIVIPLMIFIEILKDINILDRLVKLFAPFTNFLGFSKSAALPLLAGLIFGISYGAGLILDASRQGNLSKKDLLLLSLFLVICHSVFEDTFIFVAVGANALIILLGRFLFAVLVTIMANKFLTLRD